MQQALEKTPDIFPCGYIITTPQGLLKGINSRMFSLLQLPETGAGSKTTLSKFLPLVNSNEVEKILTALNADNRGFKGIKIHLYKPAGEKFTLLMNAGSKRTKSGVLESFHFTFTEPVTYTGYEEQLKLARKKQQQLVDDCANLALELEQKKDIYKNQAQIYKQISDVGRVGGWELNLKTDNLYWTSVSRDIHEIGDEDVNLGQALNFFKEGEARAKVTRAIKAVILSGESFDLEVQIVTAKGRTIWVRIKGYSEKLSWPDQLFQEANGEQAPEPSPKILRLYGTIQDIDIQKTTLLQLQYSNIQIRKDNAYYKSLIENNSFFIIKTDLEGRYTYLNPFFCVTMNIEASAFIGKSSLSLIIEEDHAKCIEAVESCFKDPLKSHWVTLRKPVEKGILVNKWEFKLLTDLEGNFNEFLCVGYEVTDLVQKQAGLQSLADVTADQNKRLKHFTYIISHDIRSHIANIKGIIDVADFSNSEESRDAVDMIKRSVYSLDDTIHNLNEVVSIQSNINLPLEPISVLAEIKRIIQSINYLCVQAGAKISCTVKARITLVTNPAYFESIVLNLLTNAIKYRHKKRKPKITVSLSSEEKFDLLTVTDNGSGMDLKKVENQLFEMYSTFHGNKDAKGLGLFIIKTQIEALQGMIQVESQVGEGSVFKVYFHKLLTGSQREG